MHRCERWKLTLSHWPERFRNVIATVTKRFNDDESNPIISKMLQELRCDEALSDMPPPAPSPGAGTKMEICSPATTAELDSLSSDAPASPPANVPGAKQVSSLQDLDTLRAWLSLSDPAPLKATFEYSTDTFSIQFIKQ